MYALKHQNIIELRDSVVQNGNLYLIMEYASGGELFGKLVKQGRLNEEEARKYFHQLIVGLEYCHSKGLCHRDLKLENLLLDSAGNLKITDFGFAKEEGDSAAKTTLGTAVYVAPEVLTPAIPEKTSPNQNQYDGEKADIWSCGIILYTLLCGCYPFNSGTGGVGTKNVRRCRMLYEQLMKAEYNIPGDVFISETVKDFLSHLIEPDVNRRYSVDECMNHPWLANLFPSSVQEKNDAYERSENQVKAARDVDLSNGKHPIKPIDLELVFEETALGSDETFKSVEMDETLTPTPTT